MPRLIPCDRAADAVQGFIPGAKGERRDDPMRDLRRPILE